MSLLNKLTEHITPYKSKSDDPVVDALERALANTTPAKAGTPWEDKTEYTENTDDLKEDELKSKFDKLMRRNNEIF